MASDHEKGLALVERLWGVVPPLASDPSPLMSETLEQLFGRIWQRQNLSVEQRSFATVGVLIALNRETELRLHMAAARNLGHADDALEELILHVAYYAGWPCGIAALRVLRDLQNTSGASK
ncbi:MAG: carboxymuconolactone decarboxylase family protein [Curvibacter sp.]|jgi:4-carboxymuconolactone decarboxylase